MFPEPIDAAHEPIIDTFYRVQYYLNRNKHKNERKTYSGFCFNRFVQHNGHSLSGYIITKKNGTQYVYYKSPDSNKPFNVSGETLKDEFYKKGEKKQ